MKGTIFSVTEPMRCIPPMKTKNATAQRTMPIAHPGMPNAVLQTSLIEFDCTIVPMKPSASVIATAKNTARNFPNLPLNAVCM